MNQLGKYLKAALDERGLSARALALKVGIGPNTVTRAITGATVPGPESLRRIAAELGLDELELLRLAGHIEAPPTTALDPEALYIALRLTQMSPETRRRAVDAVAGVIDAIYELANEKPPDAAVVAEILDGFHLLDEDDDAELRRLLVMAIHQAPKEMEELAARRAARAAAQRGDESPR